MNTWKKVPAELAAAFDAALPVAADVQRRKMFGCPAAFVNGNLFAGLHEDRLMIRLPAEAPRRPCVMMGRTMKQYALFDDALALPTREMAGWVKRAYDFTRALPAKAAKSAKAPAAPGVAKAAKATTAAGTAQPASAAAKARKTTPQR